VATKLEPRKIKRRRLRSSKLPLTSISGYTLVFVGYDHHLAAPNGYAYEHRVVAEHTLGRRLLPGEIVHHEDHNKRNNDPSNLSVSPSRWHHNAKHRKTNISRQDPDQPNEEILCFCGCGQSLMRFSKDHVEVRFISGHNTRTRPKLYKFPKPLQGLHNKIKTCCPKGHPYTEINTSQYRGRRRCLECHRLHEKQRRSNNVYSSKPRTDGLLRETRTR
jgi:hypothetical protein